MIRFAQPDDRPRLMELWARIFGDPPEAVNSYFARRHKDENMLVFVEDGVLCGMLSMLPLTLIARGAEYPARYVYAVATDPAYRGRGVATELLFRAHEEMVARGDAASVLVPASEGLFGYYAKRGYRTAFTIDVKTYAAGVLPPFPAGGAFEPCKPRTFMRMRDAAFSAAGLYALWDEGAVTFACEGMNLTKLTLDGNVGCALWERDGDIVLIRELALLGMRVPEALSILHRVAGTASYRVRLPGSGLPFGMIRWLIPQPDGTDGPGYLSLALD
jgi:GNAT superfamily N-acetyltransferase